MQDHCAHFTDRKRRMDKLGVAGFSGLDFCSSAIILKEGGEGVPATQRPYP
jgi:hypothetical protein